MRLIDVSNVNGPVDWAKVSAAGVKGAFVKATEGVTFDDPLWPTNRAAAARNRVRVGAYHFARPDHNTAVDEAQHFTRRLGALRDGELRPVLDYEVSTKLTPIVQAQWIRDFNHEVKRILGVWPIFYSYPSLIAALKLVNPVGNGLWLAAYGPNDGTEHGFIVPAPWRKVALHQFTSKGRIPGVNGYVDVSETASLASLLAHPIQYIVRPNPPAPILPRHE